MSAPELTARRGKLARLSLARRDEVCDRLLQGQTARQILPWLNALPEMQAILEAEFEGEPVNDANLSAFRQGYYAQWLQRRERVERTRELARVATSHSSADGGSIAAGAASVLAGKLLEVMEQVDEAVDEEGNKISPEALVKIASAISAMRSGDQTDVKLANEQRKLEQKDKELKLAEKAFAQKLQEYQDKVAAQKRELESALGTVKAGGMTAETLKQLEEAVKLL
jgi:hypothetical protein